MDILVIMLGMLHVLIQFLCEDVRGDKLLTAMVVTGLLLIYFGLKKVK